MLIVILNFVTKHSFLVPFFLGALACSLYGGFFPLVMTVVTIYIGVKVLSYLISMSRTKATV